MAFEQTLILIKPDGVERGLAGEIIARIERKGLKIQALRMLKFDDALVGRHYAEHVEKPFFPSLKAFVMRSPVVAMVVGGEEAILITRMLIGATRFTEADIGTIRGDYAYSVTENLVHGSDSAASAAREIPLFFKPDEIVG
jgi:nucleoside-diphosphate kinase